MKIVIILVPDGQINLISIVSSYKILTHADQYWQSLGNKQRLKIQLAGISEEINVNDGLFSIRPILLNQIAHADLIIIPAVSSYSASVKKNARLIQWVKEQYKAGTEVAAICSGAFLLAATGLVDGRSCSTHWNAADDFKKMFPRVLLTTDKFITDERGIYTNGGAFSFLNLLLYLIEKYFDRRTAIFCSKFFQIDIERNSQSPFTIFTGQKDHNDELIKKAQEKIEKQFQEKIIFENIASDLAISRRNFDRRFINATGNTPVEYWQRVRIEFAKRNLETGRKNVNEVMYDTGYSDIKAFRIMFKKLTGLSPAEYRNKYCRV